MSANIKLNVKKSAFHALITTTAESFKAMS
jgi:hypothetical protein